MPYTGSDNTVHITIHQITAKEAKRVAKRVGVIVHTTDVSELQHRTINFTSLLRLLTAKTEEKLRGKGLRFLVGASP